MIVEREYYVKLSEIGKENKITNKALLGILEDIGGVHSNIAGYGIPTMDKTHLTWILLDWKVQVIRRPNYAEKILARTWSKEGLKYYAYRDFEIYDEQMNLCAIATSKWLLVNSKTGKISRVDSEMAEKYQSEIDKMVFENEEITKMNIPENFENEIIYQVQRRDIDVIGHMHNLYYLDIAYEALPKDIYEERPFDNVRIMYKKETKLGEKVVGKYSNVEGKNVVVIQSEDGKVLHSIIELY